MSLLSILRIVFHTNTITPEIGKHINKILWSRRNISEEEMTALGLLADKLESGETKVISDQEPTVSH